jgi:hypothetical protein
MSTEFYGIEWGGLGAIRRPFQGETQISVRTGLVGLAVVLLAGCGGWLLLSGHTSHIATKTDNTVPIALGAVAQTAPGPAAIALQKEEVTGPPIATGLTSPVEGLRISSQHWRRGGLGSNALVTFTLRNTSRRDGSHLTDRTRVIHETVRSRSRRVFRHMHVGFVNINADHASCALIGASRV